MLAVSEPSSLYMQYLHRCIKLLSKESRSASSTLYYLEGGKKLMNRKSGWMVTYLLQSYLQLNNLMCEKEYLPLLFSHNPQQLSFAVQKKS